MAWREMEDEFAATIQRHCQTEEDKEAAKEYYKDYLVVNLIDDALEE